jgi:hypothetical protein
MHSANDGTFGTARMPPRRMAPAGKRPGAGPEPFFSRGGMQEART